MREALLRFVDSNGLDLFSDSKSLIKRSGETIFKTLDSKKIFNRVVSILSQNFVFRETGNFWNCFEFVKDFEEVKVRQDFFKRVSEFGGRDNGFLREIKRPRQSWSPDYDIVVVTEDEGTFVDLQKLNCPVQILASENDLSDLERYDVVQVVDCEMFSSVLERLPQSVFVDDVKDVYLERYLEELSGWRNNLEVLSQAKVSNEVMEIVNFLLPLFSLIDARAKKILTVEGAEKILEDINDSINEKIKNMTLSGEALVRMLSEAKMPEDLQMIIDATLDASGLPAEIFNYKIPVELDYSELDKYIQRQNANEFTNLAEMIKMRRDELKLISKKLDELKRLLLFEDFVLGVGNYLEGKDNYPVVSDNVHFDGIRNLFLESPSKVSFQLDNFSRCSILTGANSGGKTTLLEHIIQNISLFQLGLPVNGQVHLPMINSVYYFAKNKGSASRGAFETLLTQMSKIEAGSNTLILADEIEAVTEPGVAGKIIAATADYFIQRNCFLVIATHLGYEIQGVLPKGARIDGIEAKGLDDNFNLIVDHNPVMGRLAHSTPELIVERMANMYDVDYFKFLRGSLGKKVEEF